MQSMRELKTKLNGYELLDARPLMRDGQLVLQASGQNADGKLTHDFRAEALVSIPREAAPDAGDYYAYLTYAAGSKSRDPIENIEFYELPKGMDVKSLELDTGYCPTGVRNADNKFYTEPQTPDNPMGLNRDVQNGLTDIVNEKGGMLAPYTRQEFEAVRENTRNNMTAAAREFMAQKPEQSLDDAYAQYLKNMQWQCREGIVTNPERLEKRDADAGLELTEEQLNAMEREAVGQASAAVKQSGFDFSRGVQGKQVESQMQMDTQQAAHYEHSGDSVDMSRQMQPGTGKAFDDMTPSELHEQGFDASGQPLDADDKPLVKSVNGKPISNPAIAEALGRADNVKGFDSMSLDKQAE